MQIAAICMQLTSPHAPFKTYRYIYFKRKSLCRDANACAWSPHWAMHTMIARWFNLKTPVFKVFGLHWFYSVALLIWACCSFLTGQAFAVRRSPLVVTNN